MGETFPIPSSQYGGVIVINVFAILSAVGLVSVALRIFWLAIGQLWNPVVAEPQEYVFFRTQLGNYAACLLVGNMLNSIAGLMGLPWLVQKGITNGEMCESQAFIMQMGNWASAYFTVGIAIHTFNSLVLKKKQSTSISLPTMILGWAITGIAAVVPFALRDPGGDIYGIDGLSCGIRSEFPKLQFSLHLLPIFIASLLSACLYSLIYLVLRGTLKIKGGIKLTLDPKGRWDRDMERYHRLVARVARSMIWYPIAYIALLVPYSIMRLLVISGFSIAWQAIVLAYVCWFLLGIVNVLLLYNTFRVLGPAIDGRASVPNHRLTMESFGNTGYFVEKAGVHGEQKKTEPQPRVEQYQYQIPMSFDQTSADYWHYKSSSEASDNPLLPDLHGRSASTGSIPDVGRPITPVDELQKLFPVSVTDPEVSPPISRPGSQLSNFTPSQGLPAPPRRNVSLYNLSSYGAVANQITSAPSATVSPERVPSQSPVMPSPAHWKSPSWTGNQPPLHAVNLRFTGSGPRPSPSSTSQRTENQSWPHHSPTGQPSLLLSRKVSAGIRPPPSSYRSPSLPRAF